MDGFELPDIVDGNFDVTMAGDNADLPDLPSSDSEPEHSLPPLLQRTLPSSPSQAKGTSCPFAALDQVLNSSVGQQVAKPGKHGESARSNGLSSNGFLHAKRGLPTIDQNTTMVFEEGSDEEESQEANASSGGGAAPSCPMTGKANEQLREAIRKKRNSVSSGGSFSEAPLSNVITNFTRNQSSHGSLSRSSNQSGSKGGRNKRAQRRVGKKSKPPPYAAEDVKKHTPVIKASWARTLELKGYVELGNVYYDTLFGMAPELQGLFTLERSEMGVKFVDMLAGLVAVVDSPPKLHEKLEDLGPMHIRRGVQAAYMPQMGAVLFQVLQEVLGGEFDKAAEEAWGWVWAWLTKSMALTLSGSGQHSSLVIMSWDMALDNFGEDEVGGMVYDLILRTAPNLKSIFNRPRQVMAMKFIDMLSTVVSFADDADRMREEVRWLGVRHVKYGAKQHHVAIMGQVILSVLEEAVGEEWTAAMEKAWLDLWNGCCEAMLVAIKEAETHGKIVEDVWKNVTKKVTPARFGAVIARHMTKHDPTLVSFFTQSFQQDQDSQEGPQEGHPPEGGKLSRSAKKMSRCFRMRRRQEQDDDDETEDGPMDSTSGLPYQMLQPKAGRRCTREEAEAAFGEEVWGLLDTLTTFLWEPEQMNEKLIVLGTRFFRRGLRQAHLEVFGEAIHDALKCALACPCADCGKDEWKSHITDAWQWLWHTVSLTLVKTINSAEDDHPRIAAESWEEMKTRHTTEEIGEILFSELSREAPHVVHLFRRPKKLQSFMFTQAMDTIVMFASDPQHFFSDLRAFTIRHIKYGVKSEFVKPFGKAILQGLEELAGDKWTNEVANAWFSVWHRLASCVARSLNVGTNLITVSLVNGDLVKMQEAAECAPRGERIAWLTSVEVNGTVMSPLYWAIRDGKLSIAQFMLQDLLTIRADRECYYYGRERLAASHPDLVKVLCDDAPDLVEDLLDGLMWHSQTALNGKLRVNYFIKDLYGDPEEVTDPWQTALATLCLRGTPAMFMHPCLNKLLQLKWRRFGRTIFLAVQGLFFLITLLFTLAGISHQCSCDHVWVVLRIFTGALSALMLLFMTFVALRQSALNQTSSWRVTKTRRIRIPRLVTNHWNVVRYVSVLLVVVLSAHERCHVSIAVDSCAVDWDGRTGWTMVLRAVAAVLLWGQMTQTLMVSSWLGALSFAIGQLAGQVVRNLALTAAMVVAFGSALIALEEGEFVSVSHAAEGMTMAALGFHSDRFGDVAGWGLAFAALFTVCVHLCLFSVLIAQLVKGYDILFKDQEGNGRMNRAFQCIESESYLTLGMRKRYFEECGFDKPIEFDNGDEGPTGGVQCLENANIRATKYYVADRIMRCTGTACSLDPWPPSVEKDQDG